MFSYSWKLLQHLGPLFGSIWNLIILKFLTQGVVNLSLKDTPGVGIINARKQIYQLLPWIMNFSLHFDVRSSCILIKILQNYAKYRCNFVSILSSKHDTEASISDKVGLSHVLVSGAIDAILWSLIWIQNFAEKKRRIVSHLIMNHAKPELVI